MSLTSAKKLLLSGKMEPETRNLIARMTVKPTGARAYAINKFIKGLKKAGIWTKVRCLHVFAAHDRQAATLDWTGYVGPCVFSGNGNNFIADYGSYSGTVTKFIQPQMPNAAYNNFHLIGFSRRPSPTNGTGQIASSEDYNGQHESTLWLFSHNMNNAASRSIARWDYHQAIDAPAVAPKTPDDVFAAGSIGASDLAVSMRRVYQNGASTVAPTDSAGFGTAIPQRPYLVGGFYDNNGNVSGGSESPIRMFSAGYGLTLAELTTYEALSRAFLSDIGAVN